MVATRATVSRVLSRPSAVGLISSLVLHAAAGTMLYAVSRQTQRPVETGVAAESRFDALSAAAAVPTRFVAGIPRVNGDFVRTQLDAEVGRQRRVPPHEQLDRLSVMGRQLHELSSPSSLDELSEQFQSWMGYSPRATQPAPVSEPGEFDYATAQITDISRQELPDRTYRYLCLLLDAEGRTMEVELDAAHGAIAFELLQRIKKYPLLEQVYRQIFMPLADQIRSGAAESAAQAQGAVTEGAGR
jgi:hypothetical protein